jgi:hypothetical protein
MASVEIFFANPFGFVGRIAICHGYVDIPKLNAERILETTLTPLGANTRPVDDQGRLIAPPHAHCRVIAPTALTGLVGAYANA